MLGSNKLTLGTNEITALTGWGRDWVRRLVRDNKLPNVGSAKKILVARAALEKFLSGE